MKRSFEVKLTYFKPSGKYYTETTAPFEATDCGQPGHPCCYMNEVADKVEATRDHGLLPGLSSGRWAGPILVECEQGHPVLIQPPFVKHAYQENE